MFLNVINVFKGISIKLPLALSTSVVHKPGDCSTGVRAPGMIYRTEQQKKEEKEKKETEKKRPSPAAKTFLINQSEKKT